MSQAVGGEVSGHSDIGAVDRLRDKAHGVPYPVDAIAAIGAIIEVNLEARRRWDEEQAAP